MKTKISVVIKPRFNAQKVCVFTKQGVKQKHSYRKYALGSQSANVLPCLTGPHSMRMSMNENQEIRKIFIKDPAKSKEYSTRTSNCQKLFVLTCGLLSERTTIKSSQLKTRSRRSILRHVHFFYSYFYSKKCLLRLIMHACKARKLQLVQSAINIRKTQLG